MNAKTIASAVILSFAAIGAAQAGNSEPDNVPFQGVYGQAHEGAARAHVIAELQQARKAGLLAIGDSDNTPYSAQADSGVTRAQVAASARSAFGDQNNQPFEGA